jgi:choline dehydrogenase-like flavoprotein
VSHDIPHTDAIVSGRTLSRGFEVGCDVVIVGSGAGGAVAAALLAEAGHRVIVLEEGPYVHPDEYQTWTPSESIRRLYREAGLLTAFGTSGTPIISLTLGRAVGGSSLLTGGVCFRIPSEVHHTWVRDLGLTELSEEALQPAYEEVERRMRVREVPAWMRSFSTAKFVEGAGRMGLTMQPIRRNTGMDCEGNARCNFTCPAGAKRSVDVSYLPSATAHGARIVSDALVARVLVENGRAAGVEGHLLTPEAERSHAFTVRAPIVIAACGTIHTPLLLFRTGLSAGGIGDGLTLHPSSRVVARFDEVLNGWDGALQSVYCKDLLGEGLLFNGVYSAPNVLAAGMPGVGPALRRRVRALRSCAVFGAMVHDDAGGTVRPGLGREPLLWYSMAPRDLARLRKGIRVLCEMAFAGGAREVFTSILGAPPLTSVDQARALERAPLDPRRIECMAFHPLGSARAANDPRRGVVDQSGEAFELPGLFVMDGSILPTSIGVNSQVPIMSMSARLAWRLAERIARDKARAARPRPKPLNVPREPYVPRLPARSR